MGDRMEFLEKICRKIGKSPHSYMCTDDGKIEYFDWWECDVEDEWFRRFIKYNFKGNYKFNFYSVFGNGKFIRKDRRKNKIFFSGENLEKRFRKYKDYCLDCVDLSMGFGSIEADNYLRFPLWITYVFSPESTEKEIQERVNEINSVRNIPVKDCALIARHDAWNTRAPIYNGLCSIMEITCAGKWNNNSEELWEIYNDDKISYLKNFKFNICPENTNSENYVTEKIFEAFIAGCIPIYYGANNFPEKDVINRDAVLFWNMDSDNYELKIEIERLLAEKKYYEYFIKQPKLLLTTGEYVALKFEKLRSALNGLLS